MVSQGFHPGRTKFILKKKLKMLNHENIPIKIIHMYYSSPNTIVPVFYRHMYI